MHTADPSLAEAQSSVPSVCPNVTNNTSSFCEKPSLKKKRTFETRSSQLTHYSVVRNIIHYVLNFSRIMLKNSETSY